MLYYHLGLISLAFWFPAQIAADCSACNSYAAALKSCQKTPSANVTLTSSDMDTDTVHCMCISSSSHSEINKCRGCAASDVSVGESLDFTILAAWLATCNADDLFGDDQAALCWRSQPSDYVPCVSNTGGGSGTLSGGASSSAATLPQRYVCAAFTPRFRLFGRYGSDGV